MLVDHQQIARLQLRIDERRQSLPVGGGQVEDMRLRVDHPRQLVRFGRHHERPEGRIEVVQRNDGEHPVHGRSDRAPALVVGVGAAALVARRAQIGDRRGQVCESAERGLHGPDHRRMFGNRGEPRFRHPVATDGVLGRFGIGKRRRIGAALHLFPDDTAKVSRFLAGQDVAHNQVAFLMKAGDLLLVQGWGEGCTHTRNLPTVGALPPVALFGNRDQPTRPLCIGFTASGVTEVSGLLICRRA